LREHIVEFSESDVGKTFRFKLRSVNEVGSTDSPIGSQLLAKTPDAPSSAPYSDESITTGNKLGIRWDAEVENGGASILSYSLEMDDGTGDDFIAVVGLESDYLLDSFTVARDIKQGTLYRLRYRCRNSIGWSEYSPIAFILAATAPSAP